MSFDSLLVNTCTIRRWVDGGTDAYGNPIKTWGNHLTLEPCRISYPKGRQMQILTEVVPVDAVLFIDELDITEADRVIVDGITYEILFVATLQDGIGSHHAELSLKRVIP